MNQKWKRMLMPLSLLAAILLLSGCAGRETPYQINDGDGYNVSVRFDANGGTFTTNTSVIVDSYNVTEMKVNAEGMAEAALLSPDDENRGNDAFFPANNGYFLAGWYKERTDTGAVDENGSPVYTYSGRWDFENDLLTVDPAGEYTAEAPVLTLYAAWVPLFQVEFYDLDSGEYLNSLTFDPQQGQQLQTPRWDEKTGAMELYKFPQRSGYTFDGAYFDEKGSQKVDSQTIDHPGKLDLATGTAENASMKLYIRWREGEWYRIYTPEQFLDNASVTGCYEICSDLDFTGQIWPSSFMYGNFSGIIQGNGHVLRNISLAQTNNSKVNAGLFGNLTEDAVLSGVTFENVTFTIQSGTRVVGTSYGLLAGTLSEKAAVKDVRILNSRLLIDSGCYFGVDDYSIGLVCGMGDANAVPDAEITCEAAGDKPESVSITVNGNTVTVSFAS